MFSLFKRDKGEPDPPIPEWDRNWMEDAYKWLIKEFGIERIRTERVILPLPDFFPIDLPLNSDNINVLLKIILTQMDIDPNKVELHLIDNGPKAYNTETGYPIFLGTENDQENFSGTYWGENEFKKFEIGLDIQQLNTFQLAVATLAHESSHIILSGIKCMEEYDEFLTDLLVVYFGLGIFNANSAFQFYKSYDSWGYSKQGYLNQEEWAYALALFASIRNEQQPDWINYLEPSIKKYFTKCEKFISHSLPEKWYLEDMSPLKEN